MKKTIVYLLGRGSSWEDNEIRYSLRSLAKYGKNVKNVVIVGYCPDFLNREWLHLINHDDPGIKTENMKDKLIAASLSDHVTDDFVFMCDDYILFEDVDFATFTGFQNHSSIFQTITFMREKKRTHWWWYKVMCNTYRQLRDLGLTYGNYGLHVPFPLNGNKLLQMESWFTWKDPIDHAGIEVFSCYANYHGLDLPKTQDNKFTNPVEVENYMQLNPVLRVSNFSLKPDVNEEMRQFLKEMFPKKCFFER